MHFEMTGLLLKKTFCVLLVLVTVTSGQQGPDAYLGNIIATYERAEAIRVAKILFPFIYGNYSDDIYKQQYQPQATYEQTYDFIVIGSGASGAVLANRLSEIQNWKILLLEVGQEPHPISDIPIAAPALQFTNYTWQYLAERQERVGLGLVDQRMALPRGRVLGGSSVIDYMLSTRGNRFDYDRWAQGNPGWSYDEVLPYFKRLEDSHLAAESIKYHGKGGPLTTENVPYVTESAHAFVRAGQQAGLKYRDFNGKQQIGLSYTQATLRNGRRCSVEKAYIRPVRSRQNLKILTKARASRILIDPNTKQAYGIEYLKSGHTFTAKASKEILLAAGAFDSPKLLILSGIGPKEHLEELGIPLLKDLPVGKKMYDHLIFPGLIFEINQTNAVNNGRATEDLQAYFDFIERGRGPLTSTALIEALGYLKTNPGGPPGYPDVELMFLGGGLHTDRGIAYRRALRMSDRICDAIFRPLEPKGAFMVVPKLLQPKSVGYIKLKSTNVFHWPKFYGNYLSDANNEDVKTLIAAIREIQKIVRMDEFKRFNTTQVTTRLPGCELFHFDSDSYWECAIRHIAVSGHHQVGTCKMGPLGDPEAVVDSRLKVHGIKGLRVVDSGVIPRPLAGERNVPTVMMGEKAADLIKEDWKNFGIRPESNAIVS